MINNHSLNECAFKCACVNGHLEVAKWIFSLGGVNHHANNEWAFRWACFKGHLEVAEWIFSLGGVKIDELDDFILEINSLKIIRWVDTIKDIL